MVKRKHPEFDLYIYDYTQKCQFEKKWTDEIKMCRGLVCDSEGNVIARPFDKFFNMEEFPNDVPQNESFVAYDKYDGSLGIVYEHDGKYFITTRGSFESDQAKEGTKMLNERIGPILLEKGITYLFEIIYPENRIVIDYHGERKLVFLGGRDIQTGKFYHPTDEKFSNLTGLFEFAKTVENYKTPRDNSEGVVLYFESGFMCKVKYEEYVRLHRLVTGITSRRIWDLLRNNQSVDEMLERVPEEFEEWVRKTVSNLMCDFNKIKNEVISLSMDIVSRFSERKDQAVFLQENHPDLTGMVFKHLDGKPYDDSIWRRIKPVSDKPFKEDL